ncbi:IS4/Tn5 family transposase DNA-binding protein [Allopusillimonas ginsengisoli]|uniref:IS4/Tn5 family transposase DNA-binding protein n=1 Tax=Allopusillimonas ginsengisoli TaxID=453575 RepID=UPI003CC8AE1A
MIRRTEFEENGWAEQEGATTECGFCDALLVCRFRQVLKQITGAGEPSIPFACQDAAQSKAAYRFFSNPRVDERAILSGHMCCTRARSCSVDHRTIAPAARYDGNLIWQ